MSATLTESRTPFWLTSRTWNLDQEHSRLEFQVRHLWGLNTVSGHFTRFNASIRANDDGTPQITAVIDAASLDTGNARRDQHLRSADFFDADNYPFVRFTSANISTTDSGGIRISGGLEAAGKGLAVTFDASVRELADGEIELAATAVADHRLLGMTWSPLGMVLAPTTLVAVVRLSEQPELPW